MPGETREGVDHSDWWEDVYDYYNSRESEEHDVMPEPESEELPDWSREWDDDDWNPDHWPDDSHGHDSHEWPGGRHHPGHGRGEGHGHDWDEWPGGRHHPGHWPDDDSHDRDDGWWPWGSSEETGGDSGVSSEEHFSGSTERHPGSAGEQRGDSGEDEGVSAALIAGPVILFCFIAVALVLIIILLKRRIARRTCAAEPVAVSTVEKPKAYAGNPLYGNAPKYEDIIGRPAIAPVHFTGPNAPPPVYTSKPDLRAASRDGPPPSYSGQSVDSFSQRNDQTSMATPPRYESIRSGSVPPVYETIGSSAPY